MSCRSTEAALELRIPGTLEGLDPEARAFLDVLEGQYADLKARMTPHFHEHYVPYAEAIDDLPEAAAVIRSIQGPDDLWPHIRLVRVWMSAYDKPGEVEFAYRTGWDIEHMIGVLVAKGHVIDFCGSVGPWW